VACCPPVAPDTTAVLIASGPTPVVKPNTDSATPPTAFVGSANGSITCPAFLAASATSFNPPT
jgi:hypothetical protein